MGRLLGTKVYRILFCLLTIARQKKILYVFCLFAVGVAAVVG